MNSSNTKTSLQEIYDERYLKFLSGVFSSSRYYTNLRDQQLQNQSCYRERREEHRDEVSIPTVLYCRETDSKECNITESKEITSDNSSEKHASSDPVAAVGGDDCGVESVLTATADNLFNNDLFINDTDDDSDGNEDIPTRSTTNTTLNKKVQGKKSKQKKRKRKARSNDDFGATSSTENILRDIVKSAIAIDIQKQAHTNIFILKDEDLQELRNIYGHEAGVILKLEQQQELMFQKACDKITPSLPKYNYSLK